MANSAAIEAGGAYVRLFTKDAPLRAGLRAAGEHVKKWGLGMTAIGAKVFGAGAAAAGALFATAKVFDNVGSSLIDAAEQTGIAVEALSELGFAAAQSGASFEDVITFAGKMSQALVGASEGSKEAKEAFAALGLSADELRKMGMERAFTKVAIELANVDDAFKRNALMKAIGGKGGAKMAAMFKDLGALRIAARATGGVMSQADAERADKLGDSIGALRFAMTALVSTIGGALAPSLSKFAEEMMAAIHPLREWLKANPGAIVGALKLTGAVAALGAAIYVLGAGFSAAGTAIAAISAGFAAIVWYVKSSIHPLGLLYQAIKFGVLPAYLEFTESGKRTAGIISASWEQIKNDAVASWGGIVDAVMAGDLELAAKIAWTGMKVLWADLVQGMRKTWEEFKVFVFGDAEIANAFFDGLIASWERQKAIISEVVAEVKKFIESLKQVNQLRAPRVRFYWMGRQFYDSSGGGQRSLTTDPTSSMTASEGRLRGANMLPGRFAPFSLTAKERADRQTEELGLRREKEKSKAELELQALRDQLAAQIAAAKAKREQVVKDAEARRDEAKIKLGQFSGTTQGTFNPFAAASLGGGNSLAKRQADDIHEMRKQMDRDEKIQRDIKKAIENVNMVFV